MWKRNKFLSIFGMFFLLFIIWFVVMTAKKWYWIFHGDYSKEIKPGWYASVVMVFGSVIGGGTAEGGGAVSYPVFTLALSVKPLVARNFTLMIQTVQQASSNIKALTFLLHRPPV